MAERPTSLCAPSTRVGLALGPLAAWLAHVGGNVLLAMGDHHVASDAVGPGGGAPGAGGGGTGGASTSGGAGAGGGCATAWSADVTTPQTIACGQSNPIAITLDA